MLCVVAALTLGYFLGSRRSWYARRGLQRALNKQGLELLDVQSDRRKLQKLVGQSSRKDKLVRLSLKRLSKAERNAKLLSLKMTHMEKRHFIQTSRMRLATAQSKERTRRAVLIASQARNHLKRIEQASPVTQTINAPPPKSYGQAAAVPVRVVDQHMPDVQQDAIMRVSNRDSVRLTRLHSSNESSRFLVDKLNAMQPPARNIEQKLNNAGFTRVEQLAQLSDSDISALREKVEPDSVDSNLEWRGRAQKLLS